MAPLRSSLKWSYKTEQALTSCVNSICCLPMTFGTNPFNLEQYDCVQRSDTELLITFKGARFGKLIRTEVLATFSACSHGTIILLSFQRELFGLPPMTSINTLDCFMEQKIGAQRISS